MSAARERGLNSSTQTERDLRQTSNQIKTEEWTLPRRELNSNSAQSKAGCHETYRGAERGPRRQREILDRPRLTSKPEEWTLPGRELNSNSEKSGVPRNLQRSRERSTQTERDLRHNSTQIETEDLTLPGRELNRNSAQSSVPRNLQSSRNLQRSRAQDQLTNLKTASGPTRLLVEMHCAGQHARVSPKTNKPDGSSRGQSC